MWRGADALHHYPRRECVTPVPSGMITTPARARHSEDDRRLPHVGGSASQLVMAAALGHRRTACVRTRADVVPRLTRADEPVCVQPSAGLRGTEGQM